MINDLDLLQTTDKAPNPIKQSGYVSSLGDILIDEDLNSWTEQDLKVVTNFSLQYANSLLSDKDCF